MGNFLPKAAGGCSAAAAPYDDESAGPRQRSCYNNNFRGFKPRNNQARPGIQPVSGEQTTPAGPGRQEASSVNHPARIHRRAPAARGAHTARSRRAGPKTG